MRDYVQEFGYLISKKLMFSIWFSLLVSAHLGSYTHFRVKCNSVVCDPGGYPGRWFGFPSPLIIGNDFGCCLGR